MVEAKGKQVRHNLNEQWANGSKGAVLLDHFFARQKSSAGLSPSCTPEITDVSDWEAESSSASSVWTISFVEVWSHSPSPIGLAVMTPRALESPGEQPCSDFHHPPDNSNPSLCGIEIPATAPSAPLKPTRPFLPPPTMDEALAAIKLLKQILRNTGWGIRL